MYRIQTILHPTDFSPGSRRAFQVAASLAHDHKARLIVLFVMMPSSSPLPAAPANPMLSAESQNKLGAFPWPESPFPDLPIDHRVAEGDAPAEILRLAEREKCDLIVLGTQGRTGLKRALLGSVAEEVLRKSACPVLTVRAPLGGKP
jgi:nucleotide-binding universal stress UspA family protein